VTDPVAFWPGVLGISFLVAGIVTYRRNLQTSPRYAFGFAALGPVLVAASIAAFSGEHFTAAPIIARLVPKWMPVRLFIAYFVGAAHLAAALSFITKRYIRWSALGLALMFTLFVLLMDLPAAVAHPAIRISWSLAARQATFAMGALALFAAATMDVRPRRAKTLAAIARIWTAAVLIFYGTENIVYPQFTPGVPDLVPTQAWIPHPALIAYATGILLVAFGIAMLFEKYAAAAAASCGLLMTLLTLTLYVPQWIMARSVLQQVTAINFVFDTLLFAGTVLMVSRAIAAAAIVTRAARADGAIELASYASA
jgi:uncharacterized membrane protein YphA (DoxX/SURF4 family)